MAAEIQEHDERGAGLTPLVSMLKCVLRDSDREVVSVHGVRNGSVRAMKDGVKAAAETNRRLTSIAFYESPLPGDAIGYDHDHAGRFDLAPVASQVVKPDADYHVCGPIPFMRAQVQALKSLGVADKHLHYEVFGTDVFEE